LQKIKEEAKIYGRDPKNAEKITQYQKQINQASEELCMKNPSILCDRKLLLESARERVHEMGYPYKKGKSRSKKINPGDECDVTTPKRRKISSDYRLHRISDIQERLADIKDQLGSKKSVVKLHRSLITTRSVIN